MATRQDSFIALIPGYLEDCLARGQSDRTVEGKRSSLLAFARWCSARNLHCPYQVTEEHLEEYQGYLHAYRQPLNSKPLDSATQRKRLTDVKLLFRRLKRQRKLLVDPGLDFELPRVPRRLPQGILTVEEIERILDQALLHGLGGIRDRAVLETYYATGIRRMELARLDIEHVDLQAGLVTIIQGKNRKDRRVPIAARACEWIARYKRDVRPIYAQVGSGQTLFLDDCGRRFREQQLTRIVSKYVKRAGVMKRGACNLFRHSTATLMHENGADILDIQEMLGHTDISTTQIYTHVTIRKLREVYAQTHPAARPHT
jgi:integrase/recombinase XerD